jgi:phosphate transport system substrate-binding protein
MRKMPQNRVRQALLGSCALAALALGAFDAQAQTQIHGGGSTLAGPTYQLLFTYDQGNLDTTDTWFYNNAGSGAGARGILCNDIAQDPVSGETGSTVHFGASDNPLTGTQITQWNNNQNSATGTSSCTGSVPGGGATGIAQGGPLVQVPTFGTPVTIAYDTPAQTANLQLNFTDDQLCRIFSGLVTSWSDPSLTSVTVKHTAPTGNITVVYRSDGSGTSALFTSHLNKVCTPSNTAAGVTFPAGGTQTFLQIFPGSTLPASLVGLFIGASGSGAVSTAIGINGIFAGNGGQVSSGGHSASVGYISPDYTAIQPQRFGAYSQLLMVASVVNHNDGKTYSPNEANTATSLALIPPPSGAALKTATNYIQANADPSTGYPIVGYTTFILPSCYQDSNVANGILDLLFGMYTDPNFISIIQGGGFVNMPQNWVNALNNNIIQNNNGNNVALQDSGTGCGTTYVGR